MRRSATSVLWASLRAAGARGLPTTARALAFSLFLAIPSTLLFVLGAFSLLASRADVERLVARLESVMPADVARVVGDSLQRTVDEPRSGAAVAIAGFVLAAWSTTSAATSLMHGVTSAYELRDRRGFVRRKLVALAIVGCLVLVGLLLLGLLILGPHVSRWVGHATGEPSLTSWIWWSAQWPLLLVVMFVAFAVVLYLGPDSDEKRWRLVLPGAAVTLVVWLAASAALAVYSARFGSYEKTWGTLSAVVVTLLWLWLGAAAVLFGAEVNAQLRAGAPEPRDTSLATPDR